MKDLKLIIAGLGVACTLAVACNKMDRDTIGTFDTNFTNKAQVQVYQATVGATRNYIYVDGKQVTGATLSSGSIFPVSLTGTGFLVDGGLRSILVRDTLVTTTQLPYNFAEQFGAGKRYTVFLFDTITSPRQKTVQDDIVIPTTDSTARLRFAHFTYSPVAVPNVDIYSKRRAANVFTNVALTEVTSFIDIKANLPDTFIVRVAGSGVNLTNYQPSPVANLDVQAILTPTPSRSYTLVFRGGYRSNTSTNGTVRTLSVLSH